MNTLTYITKHNKTCGDTVTLYFTVKGDYMEDVSFSGSACSICTASSSVLTETVKGMRYDKIMDLSEKFISMANGENIQLSNKSLDMFRGVQEYKSRVRCATLPWEGLMDFIGQQQQ